MVIDRGDWHLDDAKTWERACRHIALFLWWAADRGLAGPEIDAKAMAKRPTTYFIKQCDTKRRPRAAGGVPADLAQRDEGPSSAIVFSKVKSTPRARHSGRRSPDGAAHLF